MLLDHAVRFSDEVNVGTKGVVLRNNTAYDFSGLATPLAEIDEESGASTEQQMLLMSADA